MNLSNLITQMITDMLTDAEYTDIKRNELAETLGCVPSQINYVISSRFTPEHGYVVESRRGGGGYIRIYRAAPQTGDGLTDAVAAVGGTLDAMSCREHLLSLINRGDISKDEARLIASATSDNCYRSLPPPYRDSLRASVFKQLITTIYQIKNTDKSEE